MTNLQKAAIILMSLEEEIASEVLKHLEPEQVTHITKEISKMDYISPEDASSAVREFHRLLTGAGFVVGGEIKARTLLARINPELVGHGLMRGEDKEATQVLKDADPSAILDAIKDDQPQTVALVLRSLSPMKASKILRDLEPEIRSEIIQKMTQIDAIPKEKINGIATSLKPKLKLAGSKDEIRRSSGVGIASTIISYIGGEDAKGILDEISKVDPETAERMKDLIFTFDDLGKLEDKYVQRVVREIDKSDLIKAFKAAPEKIKSKILANMSDRAREELMEEIETAGPVRLADVEEAQRKVVEVVRNLEEKGEISVTKGTGEYV